MSLKLPVEITKISTLTFCPGMHVVLEFVPNHTSDKHKWFQESSKSKDNEFRNYYVWAPGTNGGPPNNWVSAVRGSRKELCPPLTALLISAFLLVPIFIDNVRGK